MASWRERCKYQHHESPYKTSEDHWLSTCRQAGQQLRRAGCLEEMMPTQEVLLAVTAEDRVDRHGTPNCPSRSGLEQSLYLSSRPSRVSGCAPALATVCIPVLEMRSKSHGSQAREWLFRETHPQRPRHDSKFPFYCPRVKSAIPREQRPPETAIPLPKLGAARGSVGPGRWLERLQKHAGTSLRPGALGLGADLRTLPPLGWERVLLSSSGTAREGGWWPFSLHPLSGLARLPSPDPGGAERPHPPSSAGRLCSATCTRNAVAAAGTGVQGGAAGGGHIGSSAPSFLRWHEASLRRLSPKRPDQPSPKPCPAPSPAQAASAPSFHSCCCVLSGLLPLAPLLGKQ
ncbi:uncharacterized protein LOC115898719 [Rhinopithecus roxellana]|uniref:uncharacterized protein LOC115898719 n=1 Tax=Rhinopithecus roxellana TaxID=61622 RepID=UPI0012377776|nr:uncharacterized protein LOC115898719 [Rhinopithecus roxellana]